MDIVGLGNLVMKYHKPANAGPLPVFQVLLDEGGRQVPHADAFAASSTKAVTSGGLETFKPVPGEGFYAKLSIVQTGANRETGANTTWEVEGPDWAGTVTIFEPRGGGSSTVDAKFHRPSAAGFEFLSKYA